MTRRISTLLALAVAGTVLAACGQVPRPFQPVEKSNNALLQLRDRAGIVVPPVAGDNPVSGAALAKIMAARLRDLDIPAATIGGNRGSQNLTGRAVVRPLANNREEILLYWELRDASGQRTGLHTQRHAQAAGTWAAGAPALLAELAETAAPALAALVQDPTVKAAAIPGFPRARLVILPLTGAPGDAAESVHRALELELSAAKLPVANRIGENDLLVLGDVTVGPAQGGMQAISIRWSLIDADEDRELGTIAQQNTVPAGSLDGPWGPVADEVARATAAGLIDLLGAAGKL
jgi:hypothetical protein